MSRPQPSDTRPAYAVVGLEAARVLASEPATVSFGVGRLDILGQGTDNVVYHKFYAGGWVDCHPHGGVLPAVPAVSSWGVGRLRRSDVDGAGGGVVGLCGRSLQRARRRAATQWYDGGVGSEVIDAAQ